jgi:hypothetical protein
MFKAFLAVAIASSAIALAAPATAQDTVAAAPALPMCSATVKDSCQQTPAQQKRAMSGEQADARDARNGGKWTPNSGTAPAPMVAHRKMSHKKMGHKKMAKKMVVTTTETTKPM